MDHTSHTLGKITKKLLKNKWSLYNFYVSGGKLVNGFDTINSATVKTESRIRNRDYYSKSGVDFEKVINKVDRYLSLTNNLKPYSHAIRNVYLPTKTEVIVTQLFPDKQNEAEVLQTISSKIRLQSPETEDVLLTGQSPAEIDKLHLLRNTLPTTKQDA